MTIVVDAHVHLGVDHAHGFQQDRAELIERMDTAGIDLAIAAPFPHWSYMSSTNEELARSLGDRILGVGLICPRSVEAVKEIDRLVDDYKMCGALIDVESTFEYFLVQGHLSDNVAATFKHLEERALPVFVHAHHPLQRFLTADLAVGIDALARRYPALPLIVNTRVPALSLVASHSTVYIESSLDTASPALLDAILRLVGPDRFFFASNAPIEHPMIKKMAFERVRCTEQERAMMLGRALANLLNIGSIG